jgi:excisionase family DNA binding protein
MLAKGMTRSEIAVNLKLSPSQLRRRLDKAKEDGVLPTLQGCADEDNVLPWPSEETFSIQACADSAPSKFLTADEAAAYLGGLNSRTLTRWAREGYLPAIPIGEGKRRLWRFLQTDLEEWMLARRQGGQNAA